MTPRRLILFGLGLILVIQLVPAWLWQTNPPISSTPAWDSSATQALAQRACFDCHSNETKWPLYSRVAPMSWLITRHVVEGRQKLNFSTWQTAPGSVMREGEVAEEIAKVINKGEMPPSDYLLLHPEARLTTAEQQQLIDGLVRSLK